MGIPELVSKTSETGLNAIGHVFLNDHGLIVNQKGKCCDPSLYSDANNDEISGGCGTGCEEMNLIQPVDYTPSSAGQNWEPNNACTDIGYKLHGNIFESNCSETDIIDNDNRNATQLRSWLMTRIPHGDENNTLTNPKHAGQIRTCVNKIKSDNIGTNIKKIKKSRKVLYGTDKYGLSNIMGNLLNTEYKRIEKKKINLIKAASRIGSVHREIDDATNEFIYVNKNGNIVEKSRNPTYICNDVSRSAELTNIAPGKCMIPRINTTEQISEVINKFEKRNNCGPNKNEKCSEYYIRLKDFVTGGVDQSADKSTHWGDKSLTSGLKGPGGVNCDNVCFCYPKDGSDCVSSDNCVQPGEYCNEKDMVAGVCPICCPYQCSCSDAKAKGCTQKSI